MGSRSVVVASLAVLALSGCGSSVEQPAAPAAAPSSPSPAASSGPCVDDDVLAAATTLATPDLDDDGTPDALLEATSGQCRGTLLAVTGGAALEVEAAPGPPVSQAYGVALGDGTVLLATRQDHPRGGFQVRLHAVADGRWAELTSGSDEPLVPFVATDTVPGTPVVAQCTDDGVRVLTASLAADPPEEVSDLVAGGPGWRVVAADYRVEDGRAVELDVAQVGGPVAPDRFASRYPDLAEQALFTGCRTDG